MSQELIAKLREQDAFLEKLSEAATEYVTIVADEGPTQIVSNTGGKFTRVHKSPGKVGQMALIVSETGQIVDISGTMLSMDTARVDRLLGKDELSIVSDTGTVRVIRRAWNLKDVKEGDTVRLDPTRMVAVSVMPPIPAAPPAYEKVLWDDVVGCTEAKQELQDMIAILRGTNSTFAAYGVRIPRGFLMYGPPGCGKTLLGRAVATELGANFTYVKGPEILDKYVGEAESRVRELFRAAAETKRVTGRETIIFIDEADAILGRRGRGISSDMEKTIVPAFLTEMDGLAKSAAIVILATNRADTLDEAVVRDGRIDRKIYVGYPSKEDAAAILRLNLKDAPLADSLDDICAAGVDQMGSNDFEYSGASLVAAAHRARQIAARREMCGERRGINTGDVRVAINKGA